VVIVGGALAATVAIVFSLRCVVDCDFTALART
jgi:hypothetical protein